MKNNGRTHTDMFAEYPTLCTVEELCKMLHIGRTKAQELLTRGIIPNRMVCGKRLMPKNAIIQYYLKQPETGSFPKAPSNFTFYRLI